MSAPESWIWATPESRRKCLQALCEKSLVREAQILFGYDQAVCSHYLGWKERIRLNTLVMVLVEMDLYEGHSAVMCVSQTYVP